MRLIAVAEGIDLSEKPDTQTQVMSTLFCQLAQIERELCSKRTKEGLQKARAKGKKLGRPKGSLGKSKLNGKEKQTQKFLALGVSKASIAKITGVDRCTLHRFIKSRGLV